MSRGPGKIEREVLALLQTGPPLTVRDLVGQVYGIAPGDETESHSEHSSLRRALAGLVRKGLRQCITDRPRRFQASQSVFTLRQVRLTTSLPTAPRNRAASARLTRRVLVPAR